MNSYFSVYAYTPWDSLKSNNLTQIKLLSLKSIFKSFPVIEKNFFIDLVKNAYNNNHYSWNECIKRIIGPKKQDFSIEDFSFIWAYDNQNRMFQFLFQKMEDKKNISRSTLVALAPPELGRLLADYQSEALLRTLSLLNTPSKIKFLMILAPNGKSIAEENQIFQINKNQMDKLKFVNNLGQMPNINGNWFPTGQLNMKNGVSYDIIKDTKGYIEAWNLFKKVEKAKKAEKEKNKKS